MTRTPWKTVAIAACVIAVCALAIAAVAVVVNYERLTQIETTRTDAQAAACRSYNDDLAAKINKLNDVDQHTLDEFVNPPGQPVRPADRQAEIDAFLAQRKADYQDAKVQPRDCSRAGIAAFYAKKTS